ncbi:MAG: MBL fold metallo-hydrolase [Planctomycetota bacterium JB042]
MTATDDLSPRLTRLPHGVTTVDVDFLRIGMASSHLIVDDGRAAFVDVGTSRATPLLLAALEAHGLTRDDVDLVVVTHVHLDHAGGAGTLVRELPRARLVVHPRGARHMIDPSKLIAGATAIYGEEEMARTYGEIAPVDASRVVEATEGDAIPLGGRTLRFHDSPGHAKHHFVVVDEAARGVFTGDSFGLAYPELRTPDGPWIFPTTSPVQFDPEALHATIDRIVGFGLPYAYLTHFGRVEGLPSRASDLHRLIDAGVAIARRHADDGEGRHAAIVDALFALYLGDLRARGATIDEAAARESIALDVGLNASGMEVWLDRERAST